MSYFTVYFTVILQLAVNINVCAECIDFNKTTARLTGVCKEGVHDRSMNSLYGSTDLKV